METAAEAVFVFAYVFHLSLLPLSGIGSCRVIVVFVIEKEEEEDSAVSVWPAAD